MSDTCIVQWHVHVSSTTNTWNRLMTKWTCNQWPMTIRHSFRNYSKIGWYCTGCLVKKPGTVSENYTAQPTNQIYSGCASKVQCLPSRDKDTEQVGVTEFTSAVNFFLVRGNLLVPGVFLTLPSLLLTRRSATEQRTRCVVVMCCTIRTPRGTISWHCIHCCISMPCSDLKWWRNEIQQPRFFEHSEQLHIANTLHTSLPASWSSITELQLLLLVFVHLAYYYYYVCTLLNH